MPKAVINMDETERFDLKSCPGGYVVLRRLTYGQWLQRQSDALKMQANRGDGKGTETVDMTIMARKVALWEFKNCIAEHNLEDLEGGLLNFANPATIEVLDPRIGAEIGRYITALNDFDEETGGN